MQPLSTMSPQEALEALAKHVGKPLVLIRPFRQKEINSSWILTAPVPGKTNPQIMGANAVVAVANPEDANDRLMVPHQYLAWAPNGAAPEDWPVFQNPDPSRYDPGTPVYEAFVQAIPDTVDGCDLFEAYVEAHTEWDLEPLEALAKDLGLGLDKHWTGDQVAKALANLTSQGQVPETTKPEPRKGPGRPRGSTKKAAKPETAKVVEQAEGSPLAVVEQAEARELTGADFGALLPAIDLGLDDPVRRGSTELVAAMLPVLVKHGMHARAALVQALAAVGRVFAE